MFGTLISPLGRLTRNGLPPNRVRDEAHISTSNRAQLQYHTSTTAIYTPNKTHPRESIKEGPKTGDQGTTREDIKRERASILKLPHARRERTLRSMRVHSTRASATNRYGIEEMCDWEGVGVVG